MTIESVLTYFSIDQEDYQAYVEGHLLALPGWAGMLYYRSQQHHFEQHLLTDYLAIRLVVEQLLVGDEVRSQSLKIVKVDRKIGLSKLLHHCVTTVICLAMYYYNMTSMKFKRLFILQQL